MGIVCFLTDCDTYCSRQLLRRSFDAASLVLLNVTPLFRKSRSPCVATVPVSDHSPGSLGNFRNEFERALVAGAVMEKTLLESSQAQSHQPHVGSAVGLRHGKSALASLVPVTTTFLPTKCSNAR